MKNHNMNSMKKIFLSLVLMLAATVSFAVSFPQDGGVYRLVNVVTGKAVTNGDVAAHNTYLSVADVNENSLGQEWTFVSLSIINYKGAHCRHQRYSADTT